MNNTEFSKKPDQKFCEICFFKCIEHVLFLAVYPGGYLFCRQRDWKPGDCGFKPGAPYFCSVLNGAGLMIGIGGGTQFSIALGQKDHLTSNKVFTHSFVLAIGLGVVFTVIGAGFPEQLATLLGAHENVMELTSIYIRTVFSFSIVFILNNCLLASLSAMTAALI